MTGPRSGNWGTARAPRKERQWRSLLLLALALIFFVPLVAVTAFASPAVAAAYRVQLPPPNQLAANFGFKTTRILDRNGKLLYEINDQNGGRRLPVDLKDISKDLVNATIATEDKDFYSNLGVDPVGIARAAVQNLSRGQVTQGASTITQQLAKNLFLGGSTGSDRNLEVKSEEAILAFRMSQAYSKDEILQAYLNDSYYGHQAYGVEAASQTYFGKPASQLSLAEASLLAGLPQAPSDYDPLLHLDTAKTRQTHVLARMVEEHYITQEQADQTKSSNLAFAKQQPQVFEAPHFVMYVRQLLEQKYGPDAVYRQGLKVTTTLDLDLNKLAEQSIQAHIDSLKKLSASNAALVAIDPATGEILAMVGSVNYYDESISGEVNVATSPRQPGSTIKPVEYGAAFMKGWGPQTIIVDEAADFPKPAGGPPYRPQNFDYKFDGPMTLRYALANSKNVPAVKTLMYVGIPDFVATAGRLGLDIQQPEQYGLSLALGAAPVPLLNMVGAYATFDQNGAYRPPVALLKVEDWDGKVLDDYQPSSGERVFGDEQAYMITSILSDNLARTPLEGPNSVLKLSRPAAAKTGSTDDYKDSWTIGYTPDLVAGVWVGNTDNKPMKEVVGLLGAGPIWHDFMETALKGKPAMDFLPPGGIREYRLCEDTGKPATGDCKTVLTEVWPTSYTPAQYAEIPGLPNPPRGGRVLGLTLSPQGGLPVPPTPTPAPTSTQGPATATPLPTIVSPTLPPTPELPPLPSGSAPPAPARPQATQAPPRATPTPKPQAPAPAFQPAQPAPTTKPAPTPQPPAQSKPTPAPQPTPKPASAPFSLVPSPTKTPSQ